VSARVVKVGSIRYRICCAEYPEAGHRSHCFEIPTRAKAEEAVTTHNAHPYEQSCKPWRVEAQAVSEWGDPDATDVCLYAMGRTLEGRLL
jgi:hypothetical protein